jgi:hypothetical protein
MPANTPTPKPPAALPDGIEIFRAGRRTADSGEVYFITEADVAACAAAYDPALHEAPLTVGHPASNHPAYGWVKSLQVGAGGVLTSSHKQVEPQFAELVADGRLKKRSASFYHPEDPQNPKPGAWYLRHVAYLGAQPPAVKGLKDIEFSEDGASRAVNFSEAIAPTNSTPSNQENTMTPEEMQAKIDTANKATEAANKAAEEAKAAKEAAEKKATDATTQLASFAESAKTQRNAGHVSFAEGEVKAGRLLPKDKGAAVAVLNLLAESQPVEFSEGDSTKKVTPVEWLKGLIAAAKPVVSFGEHAPGAGNQPSAGSSKGKTDAEIDTDAKAYARQNKVSYAEAVSAVIGFSN